MREEVEWITCDVHEMSKAPPITKIRDGLYMGSKSCLNEPQQFDVYVSAAYEIKPPPSLAFGATTLHVPLDDAPWDFAKNPQEAHALLQTADVIASWVREGKKVIIFCNMGMNRSGLLVALVLLRLGYSASRAIKMIRRRSECTLSNQSFENFVKYVYAHKKV